jgi:hypothetical protein
MAVEKAIPWISGKPGGEESAGRVQFATLVTDMGEAMRAVRVVGVRGQGLLDLRTGHRKLPILGQPHGMIGKEPKIVAVMRGEVVHQHRNLALLSDAAGAADHAIGIRATGDDQSVARPCRQMCVQGSNRGVGPTREHEVEKCDVTGLALRQTSGHVLGCCQGRPGRRDIALPHQHLGLAGVGQGKTGVGGDGAVIGSRCARVERQPKIATFNVGVPRAGGCGGQGEAVSICQHEKPRPNFRAIFTPPEATKVPRWMSVASDDETFDDPLPHFA